MMFWIQKLASLRLTLFAIGVLLVFVLLTYRSGGAALNWLLLPLGVLCANLVAAILSNRAFRLQTALLAFHVGLLIVFVLICGGLLTHLHGRIELVEGEEFEAGRVEVVSSGPLHRNNLDDIHIRQGTVQVRYVAGLQRGATRSTLIRRSPDAPEEAVLTSDRQSLTIAGYRLRPTFNKGYAILLDWRGHDGSRALGAVHFPSFPEFEWRQRNLWTTPAGESIPLELILAERVPDTAWTLRSADRQFSILLNSDSRSRQPLTRGESFEVAGGMLTVSGIRMWIGYRVDANPLLPWILAAALFSVASLGVHFQRKYQPIGSSATVISTAGGQAA